MKIINPERFTTLPKLVLFDLDNTLYYYDEPNELAMNAVRDKVTKTFSISNSDFDNAFNKARMQTKGRLGNIAASHSRLLYMQRMLELLGLGSQAILSLDLEQTYWRTFLSNAVLFPDVKKFLDDLRLLNIQKVIVTDLTSQIQFRKIIYFGLENYFNYIVTSEESGADKSDANSYKLALEKTGITDNIWMIGDSSSNDIKSSKEYIGAVTIQKLHNGLTLGNGAESPDAAFNDFSDIRNFIKKIVSKNS